jgi:uncharacterized damage-inducible protein DinB
MDIESGADEMSVEGSSIKLLDLNAWLSYQLELWREWAAQRDRQWLALPTGNPTFGSIGQMFAHAFTPLDRFAGQTQGEEPQQYPEFVNPSWSELTDWAQQCIERHREACLATAADADRDFNYVSRSSGTFMIPVWLGLAQGATHCAWHLGGLAHLLRFQGVEPPQRSDLLFGAFER